MASSVVATGLVGSTSTRSFCNGRNLWAQGGRVAGGAAPAMAVSICMRNSRAMTCSTLQHDGEEETHSCGTVGCGRREAVLSGMTALIGGMSVVGPAFADVEENYKVETQAVIERVKNTLALEKSDPAKADAVTNLRQTSNDWVAKYRREKSVAGRPSFSNMYSVLNAISGHYISFGPNYPIPGKRKDRILEEVKDAEKALKRGR